MMAGRCNSSSCHTFAQRFSFLTPSLPALLKLLMTATTLLLLLLPSTLDAASLVRNRDLMDCHVNYTSRDWTHPCGQRKCEMSAPTQNGADVADMLEDNVIRKTRELIRSYEAIRLTDKDVQTELRTEFINSQQTDGSFGKRLENVTQLNASALGHLAYELLSNLTIRVDIAKEYERNSSHLSSNILYEAFDNISSHLHNVLCHVINYVGKCGEPDALVMLGLDGVTEVCSRRAAEYERAREAPSTRRHYFDYTVLLAVESVSVQLKAAFASTRH